MKNRKRILAAVLTAVMMISMLPATAFATETVGNEEAESAVEAVTMSSEEQDVETTVEYVGEETNEATNEEPSEAAPAEETAEPADEAEAVPEPETEAVSEEAVPAAETEEETEAVQEEPVEVEDQIQLMNDPIGPGFPASFTYSGDTYTKSGDPVALNANFKIQGYGQTNWLDEYNLNGQTIKTGQVYYQIYKSGNRQIVVYEIPSLIEASQGSGYYISPGSLYNGTVDVGIAPFDTTATSYRVNTTGGKAVSKGVISNLERGHVTYGFTTNRLSSTQSGTIDVKYTVRSGSNSYVKQTYTITYKDGLNGQLWNPDQIYTDQDAVEGNLTPHFKWNGANADPERYGYRFAGWADESGTVVGDSNAVAAITITGNATYTATWDRVSVTVTKEVLCGEGVNREDVEHTVTFALWDPSTNSYVTTDGTPNGAVLTKSITITPDGASRTAVFGVDEMIPGHKLDLMEVIQVDGAWTDLNPSNSKFENSAAMELFVSHIDIYVNGSTESNNDITFTGGKDVTARVVNTYSADESEHKFVVNKRWVDYKGDDIDGAGYTATMTLYQKVGNGEPQVFGDPIVLDGTADEYGESEAWKATFSNLPYRVGEETCTYMVKETACTEGFKAYDAKEDQEPMTGYKERSNGYIYNKQDYFVLVHTSDNSEENLPLGQYDLTTKLKDASSQLYGGYYYYDANNNKVDGTVNGKEFTTPADTKPGTKYYLREVSGTYLKPSIYLIQNPTHNGLIQGLYGFVNVDDATAYDAAGLIVNGTEMSISDYASTVSVRRENEETPYTTLTASDFGGGEIGFTDLGSLIAGKSKHVIKAYFITKDHIKVTGFKYRKLQFAANDERYGAPIWTDWYPNGNTLSGLVTDKERTYEADSSAGGSAHAPRVLRTLTIGAPSETLSYTITKVYDSATEEQVVEEGNRTGEITYAAKSGYYFAGWYADKAFTVPADFADVNSNMTVYAKYVSAKDVSAAFTLKSRKSGTATFKATVSVKGQMDLNNVTVTTDENASSVLGTRSVTKTGSGNKVKYTTKYSGTAAVKGLSLIDSFTVSVAWTTADGTAVTGPAYNCRYVLGLVTVR